MNNVTVILSGYKRPHVLQEQYAAIKNQTHKDITVMLWSNYDENSFHAYPQDVINSCISAFANVNFGVWARFAYALNANTEYVCMIDDDTIPGSRWIENCLNTISTNKGLLGCRGVRFTGDDYQNYPGCSYESICGNNENIERVDIMGHSWFFEKQWLRAYWAEMPNTIPNFGGEDMHFSYVLQKHFNLYTYVPAQPSNDKEMWGSINPSKYGEDMNATSRTSDGYVQANHYWNYILSRGYKLAKDAI
jgi:glycosyltransferase involved in cell wall biosynthesis